MAALTAVGSGHAFPFGQRGPATRRDPPPSGAEDPPPSRAEGTPPSMQRRPSHPQRRPAIRGRGPPPPREEGTPPSMQRRPSHPGQRGPHHLGQKGPHHPGKRGPSHAGERGPRHPCRGDPAIHTEGIPPSTLPHTWMALAEPTRASLVMGFFLASVWQVKASHSAKGGRGFGGLWVALCLSPKQALRMRQPKQETFLPQSEGGRPARGAGVPGALRGSSAGCLLAVASPGRASSGVSSYKGRDPFRSEATLTPSRHITCLLSPLPPLGGWGCTVNVGAWPSPRLREHSSAQMGAAAGWEAAVTCWCSPCWGLRAVPCELASAPWQVGPRGALGRCLQQ